MAHYPQAAKAAERFLNDGACWSLYLWGETGSRKTSFAAAVMRRLRGDRTQQFGEFIPQYRAAQVIRAVEAPDSKDVLKRWRECPLLVLDDLGKCRDTPHLIEQLIFLLHHRYDWADGHKTIVTANFDLDEFAKRIDPATARRLEEGQVLHMEAPKI